MNKTIVLDTETTGLSYFEDEILQLSIIDDEGHCLFNEFFKPQHKTSWYQASEVNHIYPKDVENKSSINEYVSQIQEIVDHAEKIIGYNIDFDIGFLVQAGIVFYAEQTFVDVMMEFAPIYGEWSDYFEDYKWQKLTTCAAYFKYNYCPHLALEDVQATLFAYKKIEELKAKKDCNE